jgi:hypothetical protein
VSTAGILLGLAGLALLMAVACAVVVLTPARR